MIKMTVGQDNGFWFKLQGFKEGNELSFIVAKSAGSRINYKTAALLQRDNVSVDA